MHIPSPKICPWPTQTHNPLLNNRYFSGTDSFVYVANDGVIAGDVYGTVYITIPAPPPPTAGDDVYACTSLAAPCSVPFSNLLANDASPNNCSVSVSATTPTASVGTLTRNAGNSSYTWAQPAT